MNRSMLRNMMIGLTVITAAIHLFLGIGNIGDGYFGVLFLLNGIGFLSILYLILRPLSFLVGREALLHYGLMGFAAVTIVAWLVMNGDFRDLVGVFTKLVEVFLFIITWLHLQAVKGQPAGG